MRGLSQDLGVISVYRQVGAGVLHKLCSARFGRIKTQQGYKCRLATTRILAHRLAGLVRVAFDIQNIVPDLERQTQIVAIGFERCGS